MVSLDPIEQLMAREHVGRPARHEAHVFLHHCASAEAAYLFKLLPSDATRELADAKHTMRAGFTAVLERNGSQGTGLDGRTRIRGKLDAAS